MEKVAESGGWEEHHLENVREELELKKQMLELRKEELAIRREEERLIDKLKTIKKSEWELIHQSLDVMKSFVTNPAEEAIQTFASGIADTFKSNLESMLSPLKNELNSMLNELIAPFLPLLQQIFEFVQPIFKWLVDVLKPLIDGLTLNLGNAMRLLEEGFDTEGLVEATQGPWGMTGDPMHDLGVVHAHYLEWAAWSPEYNFWDPLGSYERFLAWVREKYGNKEENIGGYNIEEFAHGNW